MMDDDESGTFKDVLLEIGTASTFDRTKVSKTTMKSVLSHIRLLKRNNVPIDEEHLTYDTIKMLNRLVDTRGKKLSDLYKRQIGMTIKRLFPHIRDRIDLSKLNGARNDKDGHTSTRAMDPDFMNLVQKLIDYAAMILNRMNSESEVKDLGLYDTCLAILIISCTCLRLHEACQLTVPDIKKIRNREAVYIRSKGGSNVRIIAENATLRKVFDLVKKQRGKVENAIAVKNLDHATRHQVMRYNKGYIIISSEDYMRKKLRTLMATIYPERQVMGFNVFRKYTTSILVDGGGHYVAQALNNHSTVNTTLDHYNVVGPQTVQNTYNDIIDAMHVEKIDSREIHDDLIRTMTENKRKMKDIKDRNDPLSFSNFIKNENGIVENKPTTSKHHLRRFIQQPSSSSPSPSSSSSSLQQHDNLLVEESMIKVEKDGYESSTFGSKRGGGGDDGDDDVIRKLGFETPAWDGGNYL